MPGRSEGRKLDGNTNLSAMYTGGYVDGFSPPRQEYLPDEEASKKPGFEMFAFKLGRKIIEPSDAAVQQQDTIWKSLLEHAGPMGWGITNGENAALITTCPLDVAEAMKNSDKNRRARTTRDTIQAIGSRTLGLTAAVQPTLTNVAFADKPQRGQPDNVQIRGIYGLTHKANQPLIDEQLVAAEEIAGMLGSRQHDVDLSAPHVTLATINRSVIHLPVDQLLRPLVMDSAATADLQFDALDVTASLSQSKPLSPTVYLRARLKHPTLPADSLLEHANRLGLLGINERQQPYIKSLEGSIMRNNPQAGTPYGT